MSNQDELEISQLIHRFNQAADIGDGVAFAATFTAEGAIELPDADPIVGTEALTGFGGGVPQTFPGARHWVNNTLIDLDGDTATVRSYLMLLIAGSPPTPMMSGVYQDELVRTSDGWRFLKRTFTLDV